MDHPAALKLKKKLLITKAHKYSHHETESEGIFSKFWVHVYRHLVYNSNLQVKVIVDAWKNAAADVVTKLRQRTITPKRLEEINWRLNLQMAQSNKSKMKLPNAMFELKINDEDSEVGSV